MKQEIMTIDSQKELSPRIYEMTLKGELVNQMKQAGQFLHIRVPRSDLLLRRPISINRIDHRNKSCRIIYRVEGSGTEVFSKMKQGDQLDVLGPLGNGFITDNLKKNDTVFIIGGGIGIPPLYELSYQLLEKGVKPIHFLGYASQQVMYYQEKFAQLSETRIATDDGSYGVMGNVGNLLLMTKEKPAAVFACGNNGLLKTVEQLYKQVDNVQLSLESRMACGIGACYACVTHLQDDETGQKSVKICDEGPVFQAGKVVIG